MLFRSVIALLVPPPPFFGLIFRYNKYLSSSLSAPASWPGQQTEKHVCTSQHALERVGWMTQKSFQKLIFTFSLTISRLFAACFLRTKSERGSAVCLVCLQNPKKKIIIKKSCALNLRLAKVCPGFCSLNKFWLIFICLRLSVLAMSSSCYGQKSKNQECYQLLLCFQS